MKFEFKKKVKRKKLASKIMIFWLLANIAFLTLCLSKNAKAAGSSNVVFSENFEGAFPGSWNVFDGNTESGSDYWGVTSYRANSGSKSVWCAQVGDHSVRGAPNKDVHCYDNNMIAFMSRGTWDASKWDMAWVRFYAWIETSGNDWIQLGATGTDGSSVKVIFIKSGSYKYWSQYDARIPEDCLKSKLRLDFVFSSDSSGYAEGVYIDDITLTWYDVVLADYDVTPKIVSPGQTITFKYYIHNPSPYTVNVALGASIRDSYGNTLSDPSNDKVVSLPPGYSWLTRPFVVPSSALKGTYDVMFGIYADLIPGNGFVREWDFKTSYQALTVTQCKLTVKAYPSAHGSPTPSYGEHWYNVGEEISAFVDEYADEKNGIRYKCVGWQGKGSVPSSGDSNFLDFIIEQDSEITWLWKKEVTLTINSEHGSPDPPVGIHWFEENLKVYASVQSIAEETENSRFKCIGFAGSGSAPQSGSSCSVTFTITQPSSLTWKWVQQFRLTVKTDPEGLPSPSVSPLQEWYDYGTSVKITAQTVPNYNFENWIIDGTELKGNPITITMDSAHVIIAKYSEKQSPPQNPEPAPSSISCKISSSYITLGESVEVSGSISPAHSFVEVKITYTKPDNSVITRKVLTNELGCYNDKLQPDYAGLWSVQASWEGDADHKPATSEKAFFTVVYVQKSFRIILTKNSTELKAGDSLSYNITILDEKNNALDPDTISAYFDSQPIGIEKKDFGKYCIVIKSVKAGMHSLSVIATKSSIQQTAYDTFFVKKAKVGLVLLASSEKIRANEEIELKGKMEPAISEAEILIEITLPTNEKRIAYTTTNSEGSFTLTIPANSSGTWKFKARFIGNEDYEGAETNELKVSVEETIPKNQNIPEESKQEGKKEEKSTGLGLSEILNIVLAVAVIVLIIIFIKGWR